MASNSDFRLKDILNDFRFGEFLDSKNVFLAGEMGCAKPEPEFYGHILKELGVSKPGDVVHIGDSVKKDYEASRKAGCRALLLCHPWKETPDLERVPNEDTVNNLSQILSRVQSFYAFVK